MRGVISLIFNSFFEEQRKKCFAASSPGIPITITNTNHKLTTSMKATKATNIQIRLLVEESQQLNSKKWDTRKTHKSSANEMIPISNYMQKQTKKIINRNELKEKSKKKPLNFFLTVYYSYSFVTLPFQQRCRVKWPPWSVEDLPI